MAEDCVDFPERSRPSMTMNAPRFVIVRDESRVMFVTLFSKI